MKPEVITNWNDLTYPKYQTVFDVYGRHIGAEVLRRCGVEVIGFRFARIGELYLTTVPLDNAPGSRFSVEIARHDHTHPRLILRRKEKKYRYVTDGIKRLPRVGEYVLSRFGFIPVGEDDSWNEQECFTREEVPE